MRRLGAKTHALPKCAQCACGKKPDGHTEAPLRQACGACECVRACACVRACLCVISASHHVRARKEHGPPIFMTPCARACIYSINVHVAAAAATEAAIHRIRTAAAHIMSTRILRSRDDHVRTATSTMTTTQPASEPMCGVCIYFACRGGECVCVLGYSVFLFVLVIGICIANAGAVSRRCAGKSVVVRVNVCHVSESIGQPAI